MSFREAYGDSFFNALKGALYQTKESWWAWQGTYSTTFISALSPLAWGSEHYPLGAAFLVILCAASSLLLFNAVAVKVFGMERYGALAFAAAATLLVIQKCAYPGHAFFWFNGGVHYMGMASFFMLYVTTLLYLSEKKGRPAALLQIILSSLLAFIVAGGNYVTLLQGMMIIPFILVFEFLRHKKKALRLIPSVLVYLAGFYFNVSAPGNSVRASAYTEIAAKPLKAVIISFQTAVQKIPV